MFQKLNSRRQPQTLLGKLVGKIQETLNHHTAGSPEVARAALAISTESIRDDQIHALNASTQDLQVSLESIATDLGFADKLTRAQMDAATAAGIMAADPRAFLQHKIDFPTISTESMSVMPAHGDDVVGARAFGLEAYDERENRNATMYSIAYNMQAARQDEFGETHFPTITVTPDNVGFAVTVRLMMVYNELQRNISGALDNFDKKNIIRAIADPTILKNEQTKIVPVYRPQSAHNFVDTALIPSRTISLEGEPIVTAPLATGKKFSLLGLSQTDALLANGVMDMTDSIDSAIRLTTAYVKVGDDILSFNVSNLPLSEFTYAPQANYRLMQLQFDTTSVLLNKNTKRVDGSALTTLAGIASGDLIVRLNLTMNGSVNIELGDTSVYGNYVGVHTVQNAAGELLDLNSGAAKALADLFADAKIIGYDLLAYRANVNRRQRGQLIDTTSFTQLYNVPLLAPITAIRPVSSDGQTDTSDLQALVTATRVRTSNASVGALLDAARQLREYIDARDLIGTSPDLLGVGRFFVRPTYFEEEIDMNLVVDSLSSHDRPADIQAALVNKVRDLTYRMFRDSEYKAAADALAGGLAPTPVVVIGTDPVLARYLTVTGDLRTLGGEFECRIVSTLDRRMAGKIIMTFGVFDENRNAAPHPLNFGNMAWSPELTLTVPITRNGGISKETAVQPRFRFIVNCPIMSVLEVKNIPDVLNKLPLNVNTI